MNRVVCVPQLADNAGRSSEEAAANNKECASCEGLRALMTEARSRAEALRKLLEGEVKSPSK